MIDSQQLLDWVIRPTLLSIGLNSEPAQRLVLGTACQESICGRYIHQLGGPALGIYQMEPATHADLSRWLGTHPALQSGVARLARRYTSEELIGNLYYATAFCRIAYYRDPAPLPETLHEQAAYWKRIYNTAGGAGTVDEYLSNWQRYASTVRFDVGVT